MSSTKDLTDQARFLRNAAPQVYDRFLAAFAKYTDEKKQMLVETQGNLQLAQGHAQMCVNLLQALQEANKHG